MTTKTIGTLPNNALTQFSDAFIQAKNQATEENLKNLTSATTQLITDQKTQEAQNALFTAIREAQQFAQKTMSSSHPNNLLFYMCKAIDSSLASKIRREVNHEFKTFEIAEDVKAAVKRVFAGCASSKAPAKPEDANTLATAQQTPQPQRNDSEENIALTISSLETPSLQEQTPTVVKTETPDSPASIEQTSQLPGAGAQPTKIKQIMQQLVQGQRQKESEAGPHSTPGGAFDARVFTTEMEFKLWHDIEGIDSIDQFTATLKEVSTKEMSSEDWVKLFNKACSAMQTAQNIVIALAKKDEARSLKERAINAALSLSQEMDTLLDSDKYADSLGEFVGGGVEQVLAAEKRYQETESQFKASYPTAEQEPLPNTTSNPGMSGKNN